MKKTFWLLLAVAGIITFASCKRNNLLDENKTFPEQKWMRFEVEKYEFKVDNLDDCYNFVFEAVIDTSLFREPSLPLSVKLISPSGERRQFRYDIAMRDRHGVWLGEPKNGRLAYNRIIRQYFFFNTTGTFTIEISQITSRYELEGVNEISLCIEPASIELPK